MLSRVICKEKKIYEKDRILHKIEKVLKTNQIRVISFSHFALLQ
jgi:hypothetical protein